MNVNFALLYEQISIILELFVPGIIFIIVFQFFMSHNISSMNVLYGFIIGYLLKALFAVLHTFILTDIKFLLYAKVLIMSMTSLLLSLLLVYLIRQPIVKKIFNKINHKAVSNNAWINNMNYDDGTKLRIFCTNGDEVCGVLVEHEEKGVNSWIVLKGYTIINDKYNLDGYEYNTDGKIMICMKEIRYVEVFYMNENN